MNALADLNNPGAVATGALSAFKAGAEFGNEIRTRGALAAYARDPSQANALALLPYKPDVALKLEEATRDRQFNDAAGAYLNPARGALAPNQPNALAPSIVGQPGPASPSAGVLQSAPEQPPANPDFRVLGTPQDDNDAAFLRMLQADPKRAFALDGQMRDRAAKRLDLQHKAYGNAVSYLGGAKDEASYQAALQRIQGEIEPLGVHVLDHLPANYPGPDGLKALRLQALDAKDQLGHFMQEANIDADNARADRNTDSIISDRTARQAEVRRYHDQQSGNARRGQDIRSSDTRRGQDVRGAGRDRGAAGSKSNPQAVASPAEAHALKPGTYYKTPNGRIMVR